MLKNTQALEHRVAEESDFQENPLLYIPTESLFKKILYLPYCVFRLKGSNGYSQIVCGYSFIT